MRAKRHGSRLFDRLSVVAELAVAYKNQKKMILNRRIPDPSRLKVMVLSCPKTGNTWLRALMRHAYGLPIADPPVQWSNAVAAKLPQAFVAHQHLYPSAELLEWIVANDVVVLTTVRHPADTLLSYFHFMKWQSDSKDVATRMNMDGDTPGRQTLIFAEHFFPPQYAMSMAWARMGAHVIRYEDIAGDPVAMLQKVCAQIIPIDKHRAESAVFLSRPDGMIRSGEVNPRHIRTGASGGWLSELPDEIVSAMRRISPYKEASEQFGYRWDAEQAKIRRFDYTSFDPFHGQTSFDNGQPIGKTLAAIYLLYSVPDPRRRWPDPVRTGGDSFWNWLTSPAEAVDAHPAFPRSTYTNLMAALHKMRPDVAQQFPDPAGVDRGRYLEWLLVRTGYEFQFPWQLVSPVMDGYCDHLAASGAR